MECVLSLTSQDAKPIERSPTPTGLDTKHIHGGLDINTNTTQYQTHTSMVGRNIIEVGLEQDLFFILYFKKLVT